jgi:hypothetical protein
MEILMDRFLKTLNDFDFLKIKQLRFSDFLKSLKNHTYITKIKQFEGERITIIGNVIIILEKLKNFSLEDKFADYQRYYIIKVEDVKFKKQESKKNEYPYSTDRIFIRISTSKLVWSEVNSEVNLKKIPMGKTIKLKCNGKVEYENNEIFLTKTKKIDFFMSK